MLVIPHHRALPGKRYQLNRPRNLPVTTGLVIAMLSILPGNRLMGQNCAGSSVGFPPLVDLAQEPHLGIYSVGLFQGGRNHPPTLHGLEGARRALGIGPLDANGDPSPAGSVVLMSVGMSNTSIEFMQFASRAAIHPDVNHATLKIVNAAQGGQDASSWQSAASPVYDTAQSILAQRGLTEAQVQVVWLKQADAVPQVSLPSPSADAFVLMTRLGNTVRACQTRYPNLRSIFFSSRIYAGYATNALNPEPYAYESGFSVKWLVESQIDQMSNAPGDPIAGDLNYNTVTPWLTWGPYLWADGLSPRSDGMVWQCGDFQSDGTHPGPVGAAKVADALVEFFLASPFSRSWFGIRPFADLNADGEQDLNDVAAFVETLLGNEQDPAQIARADFNGDGAVDGLDIQLLVLALGT